MGGPDAVSETVAGLTEPRTLSLERFPIRERSSSVTQSGWRLSASCREGDGAIVLVETTSGEGYLRGEGVFLGWSRERLQAAYLALLPRDEGPDLNLNQLG